MCWMSTTRYGISACRITMNKACWCRCNASSNRLCIDAAPCCRWTPPSRPRWKPCTTRCCPPARPRPAIEPRVAPPTHEKPFYDVQAIIDKAAPGQVNVTLYCNHREFSELEYGEQLFAVVARQILEQRRELSAIAATSPTSTCPAYWVMYGQSILFLRYKADLERALNSAGAARGESVRAAPPSGWTRRFHFQQRQLQRFTAGRGPVDVLADLASPTAHCLPEPAPTPCLRRRRLAGRPGSGGSPCHCFLRGNARANSWSRHRQAPLRDLRLFGAIQFGLKRFNARRFRPGCRGDAPDAARPVG